MDVVFTGIGRGLPNAPPKGVGWAPASPPPPPPPEEVPNGVVVLPGVGRDDE